MNEELSKAFSLTLEIEGLLQLAMNRYEMTPPEVYSLLNEKCARLMAGIKTLSPEAPVNEQPAVAAPAIEAIEEPDVESLAEQSDEEMADDIATAEAATSQPEVTPAEQPAEAVNEIVEEETRQEPVAETNEAEAEADEVRLSEGPVAAEPQQVEIPPIPRPRLTDSMSVNDRYLFRRELFHNSAAEMNEAIDVISGMTDASEAVEYLTSDLCLDPEKKSVADFIAIVEANLR